MSHQKCWFGKHTCETGRFACEVCEHYDAIDGSRFQQARGFIERNGYVWMVYPVANSEYVVSRRSAPFYLKIMAQYGLAEMYFETLHIPADVKSMVNVKSYSC